MSRGIYNEIGIRGCEWDKWDMKFTYCSSLCLNLELLGPGQSWYRVSWLLLQKADPRTATGGGPSLLWCRQWESQSENPPPFHCHSIVNWSLLAWLTTLSCPISPMVWEPAPAGFASAGMQQVTLNTTQSSQQSNNIPTRAVNPPNRQQVNQPHQTGQVFCSSTNLIFTLLNIIKF